MRTLLLFLCFTTTLQAQRTRNIAWYTPSSCTTAKINGLAVGAFMDCLKTEVETAQTINGIDVELVGIGLLLPLAGGGGHDIWEEPLQPLQMVNGLVISAGGFVGRNSVVNGLNLSGLNTMTGKVNGLTTGLMICLNRYMNGLAVGGIFINKAQVMNGIQIGGIATDAHRANGLQIGMTNEAKVLKGVQIGLINSAKNMKGLQIGLWNMSGKRGLPFLNFQL